VFTCFGGESIVAVKNRVDCEFWRANPKQHQCVEGDCYNGNTKATEAFGNCCMRCPGAMNCDTGCMKTEELKGNIVEKEVQKCQAKK
jgi:hypothetical protein